MDNELLRFFLQNQDLVTEHRPIRLRLGHSKQLQDHILLPQQVSGTEAVCGGIEYRIQCVSLSTFIPLKDLIALPVAIDLVTDRGNLRSICGLVTEAHAGESDGGLASYQLVLRDALAIMEKRTNTRVFRNMSEIQIVQELLDEWRQANPIISACFQYKTDELFASVEYPSREFTMQYNESDAGFIRRLLKRRGIAWYFQAGHDAQIQHTMVLFNHPGSLPESAAGEVRYHQTVATEERDTINAWHAIRTLQPGQATRFSWNYKRPSTTGLMVARAQSAADQGRDGNQLSATLDDYQIWPPHVCENYDDLLELGQLAIQRHDYESKCFIGEGSVRDLCAGEYFTLDGHPEIDKLLSSAANGVRNVMLPRGRNLMMKIDTQDAAGDGTVPAISGAGPANKIKHLFRVRGFDHQGSYNADSIQRLTLHLIVKIVNPASASARDSSTSR